MAEEAFWHRLDELLRASRVVVDRPAGSTHPRYPQMVYPFDYGFLESTQAMDQGGIDVWLGSQPERQVCGLICTVDLLRRDAEVKLLLSCSREEAGAILQIHNQGAQSGILLWRENQPKGQHKGTSSS